MTHTAGPGWAQLNPNRMTSCIVTASIVQYNTVPAPTGLCPNQFGLLFLPVSPLPYLPWQCAAHYKQSVCKQTVDILLHGISGLTLHIHVHILMH